MDFWPATWYPHCQVWRYCDTTTKLLRGSSNSNFAVYNMCKSNIYTYQVIKVKSKGKIERATGAVSRPETSQWRPFWLAWATLILPYRRPWLSSEYKEAIFDLIKVAPVYKKGLPVPTKSLWTGSHFWKKWLPVPNLLFFPLVKSRSKFSVKIIHLIFMWNCDVYPSIHHVPTPSVF